MTEWLRIGSSVTTPFALAGLLVVAGLIAWHLYLKYKKQQLDALSPAQRDELVSRYKVDGGNLTKEQKFSLISKEMDHKTWKVMVAWVVAAVVVVILFLIAALTYVFRPADVRNDPIGARTVSIEIISDGKIVQRDFDLMYQDEKGNKSQTSGKMGRSTVQIAQDVRILNVVEIGLHCFRQTKTGPYEIIDGKPIIVSLERITTPLPPPLLPTLIPDALAFIPTGRRPSVANLKLASKIKDPGEIVLQYENRAGEFLVLLLYNLDVDRDGRVVARLKHELPSDHCLDERIFNGFNEATGWFGILARKTDGKVEFLDCLDLYANKRTNLAVEMQESKLVPRYR